MDSLAWPLRRLRPSHWIVIDCVITAQLLLVYIELKAAPFLRGIPLWAASVIIVVAVVPAAMRRYWPVPRPETRQTQLPSSHPSSCPRLSISARGAV